MPYTLQIVTPDGKVAATWPAGHPIERDLAEAIVSNTLAQGVGVFRTEAQVAAAIRAAVATVVLDMKQQVRPR